MLIGQQLILALPISHYNLPVIHRYIDMILRKRGPVAGFRLNWGARDPRQDEADRSSARISQISGLLGKETLQLESDEEEEKDDYFSDEPED